MDGKRREEIRDILDHFEGKEVTQDALTEYCNLKGYQALTLGEYEDCRFQDAHDRRFQAAMPEILKELENVEYAPEFSSETIRQNAKENNAKVEQNISGILEKHDVQFREISLIMDNLQSIVDTCLSNGKARATNMANEAITRVAQATLGEYLTMQALANYVRSEHGTSSTDTEDASS